MEQQKPKILLIDIETAPILGYVWGLWENNVGLNQIKSDWYVLSWAAKWLDDPKVLYADLRGSKNLENDKSLLQSIWRLLDDCDILITQNGKAFDTKKLNARFVLNGMKPPSSYRQIDTLLLAKKHFAFTSNKLEYMSDKLCTKYKKQVNRKFDGFRLWSECLKNNKEAWKEMEKYNRYDVLALEELYKKLQPWDNAINFDIYSDGIVEACNCGSLELVKNGFCYTASGRYQRYQCAKCGAETKGSKNLLSKEKKASLRRGVSR